MKSQVGKPLAGELVSLGERVVYLQALRIGFSLVVLGSGLLAEQILGRSFTDLLLATAAYVTVSAVIESLRRMGKGRSLMMLGATLLIDGVYLAWAMYATGGAQSPLRFLVYLHLVAVTLLASYRTGLKIALWHSLLFFVVFYAQAAGLLAATGVAGELTPASPEFTRYSVFNVMAFWMVAIGTAAFSALNERELRRRKADLEDLASMASALQDATDPAMVADTLLTHVGDSFGYKRGAVVAVENGNMPLLAYRGPGETAELSDGMDDIVASVCGSKEHALLHTLGDDNPRLSSLLPFAKNLVVIPLVAEGETAGVLVLEHPESAGSKIEKRVLDAIGQFAAHGALALKGAELMAQVQQMANTDALTGIANRRTFQLALEREISRATRHGEPVTLMMIDVDHFKKFNDTHGHQAGDEVLRAVGSALAEASRDFDTPARYGGEEFAVILPSCTSRESVAVAERLRAAVCEIEAVAPITASAGVATYPTHAADAETLIKVADEALYESKRAGRDRLSRSRRRAKRARPSAAESPADETSEVALVVGQAS
jgi:two-component system, cell cycle response regulator